jgi:hypothetical protein
MLSIFIHIVVLISILIIHKIFNHILKVKNLHLVDREKFQIFINKKK